MRQQSKKWIGRGSGSLATIAIVICAGAVFAASAAATPKAGPDSSARGTAGGPEITWARDRFPVRSGVASRRLCRVTAKAAEGVKALTFSSPASPRVRVVATGRPFRKGAMIVFPCRVETQISTPPRPARVRATAVDNEGDTRTVTAIAVIIRPTTDVGQARRVGPEKRIDSTSPPVETGASPGQLFSPSSFWNRPMPASAALVAQSATYVQELVRQVGQTGATINTTSYSTPVYTVGPSQPTTKVTIVTSGGAVDPSQQAALNAVPLPSSAKPAAGGDRHLVVWQPSTNSMWEFWNMRFEAGRWVTDSSGAMNNVSTNPGYFDSGSWPGAKTWWGATATALPLIGGLIRIGELESGRIEHALAIAIPDSGSSFVWPAQRSDGRDHSAGAIPEGTTFRLPASVNVGSLGLPQAAQAIALAAQKYGIVVRDSSSDVTLYAEDPSPYGTNPYPQLFGGQTSGALLAGFPWSQLVTVQQSG